MLQRIFSRTLTGFALLTLVGCSDPGKWAEPIGKLEVATNVTLEVTRERFSRSAELTRERAYIVAWADKKSIDSDFLKEDPESSEFRLAFTQQALSARIDMLRELQKFCRQLAAVSGSDVGKQFGTAVQATGTHLGGIADKLGASTDIGKTTGLLSKVVGLIGGAIIDGRRDEAIRTAVKEAAPLIQKLVPMIQADLDTLKLHTEPQLASLVTKLTLASNAELSVAGLPARLTVVQTLARYNLESNKLESVHAANKQALTDLAGAFAKLESYDTGASLESIMGQIETFLSSAQGLLEVWSEKE